MSPPHLGALVAQIVKTVRILKRKVVRRKIPVGEKELPSLTAMAVMNKWKKHWEVRPLQGSGDVGFDGQ